VQTDFPKVTLLGKNRGQTEPRSSNPKASATSTFASLDSVSQYVTQCRAGGDLITEKTPGCSHGWDNYNSIKCRWSTLRYQQAATIFPFHVQLCLFTSWSLNSQVHIKLPSVFIKLFIAQWMQALFIPASIANKTRPAVILCIK
jgi:hypothetical protein